MLLCARTHSFLHQAHMRVHTGDTPYACQVPGCGRRFKENAALYKHLKTHSPDRPFCVRVRRL
jgi:uncharacterized Zn-finger protein